jgi:hypothetical protein
MLSKIPHFHPLFFVKLKPSFANPRDNIDPLPVEPCALVSSTCAFSSSTRSYGVDDLAERSLYGIAVSVCRRFQSLIVLSSPHDVSVRPSAEKLRPKTYSVWPCSICTISPELTSHITIFLFMPHEASSLPLGEKATSCMADSRVGIPQ